MKRTSLTALAAIGLFILACAGGDDGSTRDGLESESTSELDDRGISASDQPSVALTDPWSSMGLPIDDGVVVASDDKAMRVAYDDASVSGLTSAYTHSIHKHGWAEAENHSSPSLTAIVYEKNGQRIGFSAGLEDGLTVAYMEDMGLAQADRAVIASARNVGRGFPATKTAQALRKATRDDQKPSPSGKPIPSKKGKKGKKAKNRR
jgi:hypothetical protein